MNKLDKLRKAAAEKAWAERETANAAWEVRVEKAFEEAKSLLAAEDAAEEQANGN